MDTLFDPQPPAPLPPLRDKLYGALGAKWTAWRGAHRPCDHCVKRIHELGAGRAPYPRGATTRRKGPNGDLFLCAEDAQVLRDLDNAVERRHAGGEPAQATPSPQRGDPRRVPHRYHHPHVPTPDPAAPDCCTCGLRVDLPNRLHTDRPPAAVQAHTAVERRKLGETD